MSFNPIDQQKSGPHRRTSRMVAVGGVQIGDGAPVSVQTMLAEDPHDANAICARIESCAEAEADIVRLTVPDAAAADTLREVTRKSPLPIVADVHFDYRCALAAIEAGAHGLRINPGNIGGRERVQAVARAAKARRIPIRVGVNGGSLEPGETLASSALKHMKLLEDEGFRDIVVSVKASDVATTVAAYRELAERTDVPLHLGVTEAGTFLRGTVHSCVAMGILLADGIGDTLRVSLTDEPEREVAVGLEVLRALGLRRRGPSVTSCPTCGRTKCDVRGTAERVEAALGKLAAANRVLPRVAIMGCAVNGPGEAEGADVALCGGDGEFLLYEGGVATGKVEESRAADAVIAAVKRWMTDNK